MPATQEATSVDTDLRIADAATLAQRAEDIADGFKALAKQLGEIAKGLREAERRAVHQRLCGAQSMLFEHEAEATLEDETANVDTFMRALAAAREALDE